MSSRRQRRERLAARRAADLDAVLEDAAMRHPNTVAAGQRPGPTPVQQAHDRERFEAGAVDVAHTLIDDRQAVADRLTGAIGHVDRFDALADDLAAAADDLAAAGAEPSAIATVRFAAYRARTLEPTRASGALAEAMNVAALDFDSADFTARLAEVRNQLEDILAVARTEVERLRS